MRPLRLKIRFPAALVAIWIFWTLVVFLMWRFLPLPSTKVAVLLLLVVTFIESLRKKMMLGLFSSIVLLNIGLSYAVGQAGLNLNVSTILFALGVFLIGMCYELIQFPLDWRAHYLKWILLSLVASQSYGLFSYWSVSMFNRSLLILITFYSLWFYLEKSDGSIKSVIGHFIFSLFIAILVLGGIIWANYPQLLTF
jgi:hypothetical protein